MSLKGSTSFGFAQNTIHENTVLNDKCHKKELLRLTNCHKKAFEKFLDILYRYKERTGRIFHETWIKIAAKTLILSIHYHNCMFVCLSGVLRSMNSISII